ncbi:PD-(D/E)XK nuclease family protein [bacterium]|nr:PD-(D/E)XK nuclease family protein [bacterium]
MAKFERKLSHTSLSTFRRCKMRYKWGYLDNHAPLPSKGLMTGGTGHVALGAWYKALSEEKSQEETVTIALKAASAKLTEYEEMHEEPMDDLWDNLEIILRRYFDWALKRDDFTAYEIEYKFELEVGDFTLIGYIDGIVERDNGTHWLLEHKFNKQVQTKHLELDPQVSIYLLAARASGFDVRGAYYNVVRTTIKGIAATEPVVRLPVFRNNEGLEQIVYEMVEQMEEMRQFHETNGEAAYRTPTRDCSWDCGFYHACLAMNDDGDPVPALRAIPLKDYK